MRSIIPGRLIFFIVFLYPITVSAQFTSWDIVYGARMPSRTFYGQFNKADDYLFGKPLQLVGLSLTGEFMENKTRIIDGYMSYCQVLPQEIQVHDSILCKVNGFVFGYLMHGIDIFKKTKNFDLILTGGFNTGRLRLRGDKYDLHRKNPFFSPALALNPRVKIGRVALGVRVEYEYDISSKRWKGFVFAKDSGWSLNKLRQDGFSAFFTIGWVSSHYLSTKVSPD